jgi:hypothetical protein
MRAILHQLAVLTTYAALLKVAGNTVPEIFQVETPYMV